MATLIVTLGLALPGPGAEFDYVLTHDGQTAARQGRTTAALLPPLPGAGHEIVAVLPARALSWRRTTLPAKLLTRGSRWRGSANPQLRSALEGLLEDELLDDPSALHMAMEPAAAQDGPRWVAVCDRAWLHAHLHWLEQAQRPVTRIAPEFEPAPAGAPAALHITSGLPPAQLVHTHEHGVAILPLGAAAVRLIAWSEDAALLAEPAVAELAEAQFKRPVTLQTGAQRALQAARSSWNLAQFELARLGQTRLLRRWARGWNEWRLAPQWRAARWAALALALSQVIGLNAWAWRERSSLQAKRAAIHNTLLQTFPETPVVLDAPLQMERQVNALREAVGAASPQDLDVMLGALGAVNPAGQGVTAIEYTSGELRAQGLQSAGENSVMVDQLQARGYRARFEAGQLIVQPETGP